MIDFRDPLPEAYELVEDGHITEDNFRDFVFANAVRLWGTQNPDFFDGTVVAKEAAAVLAAQAPAQRRGASSLTGTASDTRRPGGAACRSALLGKRGRRHFRSSNEERSLPAADCLSR